MNEQNRCRWLVPQPRRMCGRWAFFLLKLLRRGGGNGRWVELTLLFPAVCFWRNGIRTLSEFDPEPLLLDLSDGLSLLSLSVQRRHFILFRLSFSPFIFVRLVLLLFTCRTQSTSIWAPTTTPSSLTHRFNDIRTKSIFFDLKSRVAAKQFPTSYVTSIVVCAAVGCKAKGGETRFLYASRRC